MRRTLAFGLVTAVLIAGPSAARPGDDADEAKEALQALNDFIGTWKGAGGPDKPRPAAGETWSETLSWSWRFKKNDPAIVFEVKDGRYFQAGEIRWQAQKKQYELTLTDKKNQKAVYLGELKKGYLTFETTEADGKTLQLRLNLAGDNVRLVYSFSEKPKGRTIFTKLATVAATKEGESLGAAANKDRECVVTGGLGTIPVTFNGKTYYVCCTGCRDAFNESPDKFVKAFEAKRGK